MKSPGDMRGQGIIEYFLLIIIIILLVLIIAKLFGPAINIFIENTLRNA